MFVKHGHQREKQQVKKLAKEINEKIKESDVYKRYIISKEVIDSNEYLSGLLSEMKKIKDLNCKGKEESLISEYYRLENEYNENILVKEYRKNKEELLSLLNEVSDILSFK